MNCAGCGHEITPETTEGKKADCPNFRPLPTNPEVCAKWITPDPRSTTQFLPFCQVEEKCDSLGLRLTPRADQESDSEE